MRTPSRIAVSAAVVLSAFLAVPAANAQQHAGLASRAGGGPVHARPAAAHVVAARASGARHATPASRTGVHFNRATNSFQSADGSFVSLQDLLNQAPGEGFDFRHVAALNQDFLIKAAIDPVTQWKIAEARRLLRGSGFGGPGFFLWDGGAYYPITDESAAPEPAAGQQTAQEPQMVVVQAPAEQSLGSSSAEEAAPLPDAGQFVLVLQNGTQLQAVAFTRMNDRIVYITTDGNRRTIAAADLNSDATMRINEERGTPLQLSL